jgi:hypothetical protein
MNVFLDQLPIRADTERETVASALSHSIGYRLFVIGYRESVESYPASGFETVRTHN